MQDPAAGRTVPSWRVPGRRQRLAGIMAVAGILGLAIVSVVTAPFSGAIQAGLTSAGTGPAPRGTGSQHAGLVKADVGGPRLASHRIVVNYPGHGKLTLPNVPASAYVIADARTGAVLAAKDPHGLFPPASTLKVLTAVTMLPRLNPDATIVASKLAASQEENDVGLLPGHRYKVSDLFNALLLMSANDAAVALVQGSGSFSKGMALVNAEAHHLQAYDVVAKVPNGLPAAGQVVSAYDLALIARQALSMPAFMRYDSTLSARFPVKRHDVVTLVNQNYLLTQYRGGIGGKIGWTVRAEATYIGLARRNGVTLIVTVMHATSLTEIHSAEKLLNWGFAMDGKVKPVGVLVRPLPAAQPRPGPAISLSRTPAVGSLAASANRSGSGAGMTAGVLAGLFLGILGGVAWVRWRRRPGRHGSHAGDRAGRHAGASRRAGSRPGP
jgi:serine-type D-Ala-D-Ala carboxypeptidase (penicillin-binding protein 5/6)